MKTSAKVITLSAALATGLGAVYAIAPSYAQEGAETVAQLDRGAPGAPGPQHRAGPGDRGTGPMDHIRELFATFDTDGDGLVTQDEIDGVRAAELAEFDADGDGTLSLEEYQALWLARVYERMVDAFQQLDADGDGEITIEEFNAGLANIVARMDQNGDGALGEDDRPDERVRPGGPGPR
ncbi:MAG: EF-hand domain-containing protein [Alphaproteobacteria bacterium]